MVSLDLLVFKVYYLRTEERSEAVGDQEEARGGSRWLMATRMSDILLVFPLPQSNLRGANVTVFGCLNRGMPLLLWDNSSVKCESGISFIYLNIGSISFFHVFLIS